MKCDELKADNIFVFGEECLAYRKSEVDEAIAELKEKYKKLTKDHDHAIQACCDADKAMAKLKEEIKKTQEIANEQTFKLCVEKENVWQLEKELRKQKRERCLAMAKACNLMLVLRPFFTHKEYIRKWVERGNKWIDLADKFNG